MAPETGKVIYIYKGTKHVGVYEVIGPSVKLDCRLGQASAVIGILEPKKLAKLLLKRLCERHAPAKAVPAKRVREATLAALPKPAATRIEASDVLAGTAA